MSYTKFPPTGNNSQENERAVYNPTRSTFTDYGSSDTYDLPPGPMSVFSDSPENDEIVNLSDTFSAGHSSTPNASLSYESLDDEEYDELDSYIGNPTPTPSELALCETSKGGFMLLEGGFSYNKHRVTGDVTQWQCVQRNFCKARLHTKGNEVIARKSIHPHESNSYIFYNNQAKAGMKRKASESQEATHSILTASIGELNEQSAVHLPKINSLKKTIVRSRNKAENVPPEPLSLQYLEIPESYHITKKGQQFLLYDSGAEIGNQRIVIFGTQANVDLLSSATVWLADGTFKTVPSLFYQLYVIHAMKGGPDLIFTGHIFPCLYVLLANKAQVTYANMWNKVHDLCPTACPTHLIVDFEIASINLGLFCTHRI